VADSGSTLFSPASQAVIGAPSGKITLVEFFDYNCGYCKCALGDLVRIVKENPDLRLVLRDLSFSRLPRSGKSCQCFPAAI
jgi:protein-disulfide isomerase